MFLCGFSVILSFAADGATVPRRSGKSNAICHMLFKAQLYQSGHERLGIAVPTRQSSTHLIWYLELGVDGEEGCEQEACLWWAQHIADQSSHLPGFQFRQSKRAPWPSHQGKHRRRIKQTALVPNEGPFAGRRQVTTRAPRHSRGRLRHIDGESVRNTAHGFLQVEKCRVEDI